MTSSLSYLVGQPLAWVLRTGFCYDLIAPDNSAIATFEMIRGMRKAKALVPDGTLFLYQKEEREGRFFWDPKIVYVGIWAVEQDPPLAVYQRYSLLHTGDLVFTDGRKFWWGIVPGEGEKRVWKDSPPGTTASVQLYVEFSTVGLTVSKLRVVIYPQAAEIPELSLLLVLGLYNILIEARAAMDDLRGVTGNPVERLKELLQ